MSDKATIKALLEEHRKLRMRMPELDAMLRAIMSQLIDDILAFSRMGRQRIAVTDIDMEELTRTVFEDLKPNLTGREVTLEIKPFPPCCGDLAMLRMAWMYLLDNAIKFTRAKAVALIEVGGHSANAENIYYIRDNGAGIGLAIVKRIITRHGGRVWAEGKIDEGAGVYFSLPFQTGNTSSARPMGETA